MSNFLLRVGAVSDGQISKFQITPNVIAEGIKDLSMEFNEKIVCTGVTLIFNVCNAYSSEKLKNLSWNQIITTAYAEKNGQNVARIYGSSESTIAHGLTLQHGFGCSNYEFGARKVAVPLPFEFGGENAFPVNLDGKDKFVVMLEYIGSQFSISYSIASLFLHCSMKQLPTFRRRLTSGRVNFPMTSTAAGQKICKIPVDLRGSIDFPIRVRYIYLTIYQRTTIDGKETTKVYVPANDNDVEVHFNRISGKDDGFPMLASFDVWKSVLHEQSENAVHSAMQLASLPAYVYKFTDQQAKQKILESNVVVDLKNVSEALVFQFTLVYDTLVDIYDPRPNQTVCEKKEGQELTLQALHKRIAALENKEK